MLRKFGRFVALSLSAAVCALVLVIGAEKIAQARDSSFVGWLEVRASHGTGGGCSLGTGAGDGCFADDLEAVDDFEVDDDSTLRSDVAIGGLLTGSGTAAWWSVVSGANTACNTTCTAPCVFGFDSGAADAELIVACTDATADICVCAGAS